MNKAKEVLISEARKLRAKAGQKKREAEKLEKEANEIQEQIDKI